jgi:Lon protease-like protein
VAGEAEDVRPADQGQPMVVPLFPLPSTVLFPRVRQPFYVFEPRYRAMLRTVLDGDGLIGIPLLLQGKAEPAGPPRIASVFGVGAVVDYDTHEDGTSDIEVLGRHRVRMIEELPPSVFRRARVEVLPEEEPGEAAARKLHADLEAAIRALDRVGLRREAKDAIGHILEASVRDVPFLVHMLCTIVIGSPEVRQKVLEEDRVEDRGRALLTILETFGQELGRPFKGD